MKRKKRGKLNDIKSEKTETYEIMMLSFSCDWWKNKVNESKHSFFLFFFDYNSTNQSITLLLKV